MYCDELFQYFSLIGKLRAEECLWQFRVADYGHPNIKPETRKKIFKEVQNSAQFKKPKRIILTGKDLQRALNQG